WKTAIRDTELTKDVRSQRSFVRTVTNAESAGRIECLARSAIVENPDCIPGNLVVCFCEGFGNELIGGSRVVQRLLGADFHLLVVIINHLRFPSGSMNSWVSTLARTCFIARVSDLVRPNPCFIWRAKP